jgi:nucleotide-binding universal stress UspA family protein
MKIEHVLVPLDRSALAERALPHALAIARAFNARLTLLHVLRYDEPQEEGQQVAPLDWHIAKAEAQAYLDGLSQKVRRQEVPVAVKILEGKPAERIIKFGQSEDVDLIVLTSHGAGGLSGWNVSSVVQKILMRAYISIMIVRAYRAVPDEAQEVAYRKVLIPVDTSPRGETPLPLATVITEAYEGQILAVHVVERPELLAYRPPTPEEIDLADRLTRRNKEVAQEYLEQIQEQYPTERMETRLLVNEEVVGVLQDLVDQEGVDLVMLSAHGYSDDTGEPYGNLVLDFISYGSAPLFIAQDVPPTDARRTAAEAAAEEHKGH